MASEADRNAALAILNGVHGRIQSYLGDSVVMPFAVGHSYDAERDLFCKEMIGQCELAEKKAPDEQGVLYISNLQKAQLYGCWEKMQGVRGTYKSAAECYENALRLTGGNPEEEARVRYRYGIFCSIAGNSLGGGKEKAVQNFERAVQLAGANSEIGIAASKKLGETKAGGGGGMCFVATAAYGSPLASEVLMFCRFRDEVLLTSKLGSSLVQIYYFVSPPLALLISKIEFLKAATRHLILTPILRMLKSYNDANANNARCSDYRKGAEK